MPSSHCLPAGWCRCTTAHRSWPRSWVPGRRRSSVSVSGIRQNTTIGWRWMVSAPSGGCGTRLWWPANTVYVRYRRISRGSRMVSIFLSFFPSFCLFCSFLFYFLSHLSLFPSLSPSPFLSLSHPGLGWPYVFSLFPQQRLPPQRLLPLTSKAVYAKPYIFGTKNI